MEVSKVSATIRYSQGTGHGAWKVIEIGAEGSVDGRENWQSAQAFLYHELGQQMKTLWSNGNGAALNVSGGTEAAIQPLPEPELAPTTREHWCAEHQQSFTQKNGKDGSSWWSHKAPDGGWCRE